MRPPLLSLDEYLAAWSQWHGGVDTRRGIVRAWLSTAYRVARPLAALPPSLVTCFGLGVSAAAVVPAAAGGRWLILAGLLVGLSGLLDSVDGAVAIGTGRASRRGFVLDSAVDRLAELAYAVALWLAGAPGLLAAAFGAGCWLPDYLRARAGQAGVQETGAASVWERPTRVLMTAFTVGGAGVLPQFRTPVVVTGTAVGVGLAVVAVAQLGVALRRALG